MWRVVQLTAIASMPARSSSSPFSSLSIKARKILLLEAGFSAKAFHNVFVSLGWQGRKPIRDNSLDFELFHLTHSKTTLWLIRISRKMDMVTCLWIIRMFYLTIQTSGLGLLRFVNVHQDINLSNRCIIRQPERGELFLWYIKKKFIIVQWAYIYTCMHVYICT